MVRKIVGAAAAFCTVAAVQASNTVTFINIEHPGTADIVSAQGIGSSFYSDTLRFSATGTDVAGIWGSSPSPEFATVCCDVAHDIHAGDTYGATFTDSLTFAGSPTLQNGSTIAGVQHAGSIVGYVGAQLASTHPVNPLSFLDAVGGAALQLAVWETLYDTTAPTTIGNFLTALKSGNFHLTGSNMSIATTADTLVQQAWADYNGGYGANDNAIFIQATSHGANGDIYQDQFAYLPSGPHTRVFTPEPITMSLGFAGIGLFVRRRMKKA